MSEQSPQPNLHLDPAQQVGAFDPSLQHEQQRAFDQLQKGMTYAVRPEAELYPMTDLGEIAEDGNTTLRVVAELAIPDEGTKQVEDMDRLAVISAVQKDGGILYGISGLKRDEATGKDSISQE